MLRSHLDRLDLVVYFVVNLVEVADQRGSSEGLCRRLVVVYSSLDLCINALPICVVLLALCWLLLDSVLLLLLGLHLEGVIECIRVNLLQNGLQGNERLLQNLVPMVFSQMHDHRHKHGESLVLIRF